jgi:hypothetical protein
MGYNSDYSNSAKNWISLFFLHKIIRRTYLNFNKQFIEKFFPVNTGSVLFLSEVYGIPMQKMEILPLGVDDEFADESFKLLNREKIRNQLSIPRDAKVIFSGGKIDKLKRLEDLIIAFNQIKKSNLYLIIVGKVDNSDERYAQQMNGLIGSNPKIYYVGWVSGNDVYKYIAASDFAIFPGSQSVLWQQSIGMGLVTMLGKYSIKPNGAIIDQHVEYLNANNNILILHSKGSKTKEIESNLNTCLNSPDYFDSIRNNSLALGRSFLSYKSIINQILKRDY